MQQIFRFISHLQILRKPRVRDFMPSLQRISFFGHPQVRDYRRKTGEEKPVLLLRCFWKKPCKGPCSALAQWRPRLLKLWRICLRTWYKFQDKIIFVKFPGWKSWLKSRCNFFFFWLLGYAHGMITIFRCQDPSHSMRDSHQEACLRCSLIHLAGPR